MPILMPNLQPDGWKLEQHYLKGEVDGIADALRAKGDALRTELSATIDAVAKKAADAAATETIRVNAEIGKRATPTGVDDKIAKAVDPLPTKAEQTSAIKAAVDPVTTRLTTAEGKITTQAGQLPLLAKQTALDATDAKIKSLTSTADALQQAIDAIVKRVDALEAANVVAPGAGILP